MKLVVVIAAALGYDLFEKNARSEFWKSLDTRRVTSLFPALTCPVQATLRTALPVSGHGMVASGFFDRRLRKPFFWEQSSRLYSGPRIWEDFRRGGGKVAQICLQQCPGPESDIFLSPAPVHKHHGGMIQEFLSKPDDYYHHICDITYSKFNLMHYWGPFTSVKASEWITGAAVETIRELSGEKDSLVLTYIPHLDYDLQKFGPSDPTAANAFRQTELLIEKIFTAAKLNGYEAVVCGDYAISDVSHHIMPNRILRDAGLLKLRTVNGMLYPVLHTSDAFALADHQIAHIYIENPDDIPRIKSLFTGVKGIGRVIESSADPLLSHPNSGELILEAAEGSWFSYKWWEKSSEAPDYATHVDIHNKPGFDPCELFMSLWPPMSITQDDSKIKGSHGRGGGKVLWGATFQPESGSDSFLDCCVSLKNMLGRRDAP